jgi:hypothetical protein
LGADHRDVKTRTLPPASRLAVLLALPLAVTGPLPTAGTTIDLDRLDADLAEIDAHLSEADRDLATPEGDF